MPGRGPGGKPGLGAAAAPVAEPARAGLGMAGYVVAVVAAALLLGMFWGRQVNHDTAWYLVATRRWLEGARLYVDLVEVNPPLNFYITSPAVLLADMTGMSDSNAQFVLLAALLVASLALTWTVLLRVPDLADDRRVLLLAGVALALVAPFLDHIAQREQVMLVLAAPWLLAQLALPAPDRGGWGLARAAVAAVGFCLKPHFLLYPIAVTLWRVACHRSLWPAIARGNLVMLAVGSGYVALVYSLHPEYFHTILPVALLVYGDYGFAAEVVLEVLRPEILLFAAAFFGIAAVRAPEVPALGGWAAVIAAAAAAYLLQWTGYEYQVLPIHALVVMAAAWIMAYVRSGAVLPLLALAGVVLVLGPTLARGPQGNPVATWLARAVREVGSVQRLATLSTSLVPGPATALETGAVWTSRYPALWLVPGAVNGLARTDCAAERETCARLQAIVESTRRDIVSDLEAWRPEVLIVDEAYQYITVPGFSWDSFLSEDPRYAAIRATYRVRAQVRRFTILAR